MNMPVLDASAFGGRKVIDVDTHLTEPYDLWTKHAPARLKDRVPQVKVIGGRRTWVIDGDKIINEGANPASVLSKDGTIWLGLDILKHQIEDVHPASYSVPERLELMDACGITAQILYSNLLGFGGQHAVKVGDQLRLASVQIYNDAMAEIQAESGDRIFPMALLPWWDVKLSVTEIERTRKLGLRGITFQENWRLVRGLDYYMRTTFEITAPGLGSQNAVCGGGRYDGLVELLGGPATTKGIGFAIGTDRLILSLQEAGEGAVPSGYDVYLAWFGAAAQTAAIGLARRLRDAGFIVELPAAEMKFGKSLGLADRLKARYAVIMGDDELAAGIVTVKRLADGSQQKLAEPELFSYLRSAQKA